MSQKREHSGDNISENTPKHLKLEENETTLDNHNDIKKVVDKQPKITEDNSETFKEDDYYSDGAQINRCIECGVDMGSCNPRQFCGKLQCDGYGYECDSEDNNTH
jgi:heterodisulfide reductase subunit C